MYQYSLLQISHASYFRFSEETCWLVWVETVLCRPIAWATTILFIEIYIRILLLGKLKNLITESCQHGHFIMSLRAEK